MLWDNKGFIIPSYLFFFLFDIYLVNCASSTETQKGNTTINKSTKCQKKKRAIFAFVISLILLLHCVTDWLGG